ncbi:MAG: TetR/AcrR family transcriptional regulator [Sulfurovum sp.]
MAIIVNKEEKRRDIAISCSELLLENGIESITIAQIAKSAGVGKGTIYEYFSNKEDIVFEIITLFIAQHIEILQQRIDNSSSTREKLFNFCYLLFEDDISRQHLKLYKEFLAISITREPPDMLVFSQECQERFESILSDILEDEPIYIPTSSIMIFHMGLVVESRLESFDVLKEINIFLDMLLSSTK